jgi:hypothetical protein
MRVDPEPLTGRAILPNGLLELHEGRSVGRTVPMPMEDKDTSAIASLPNMDNIETARSAVAECFFMSPPPFPYPENLP